MGKKSSSSGKQTSPAAATSASKVLRDPKTGPDAKKSAGSDLAQKGTSKKTPAAAASSASKVMRDPKSDKDEKTQAASDLSQKNRGQKAEKEKLTFAGLTCLTKVSDVSDLFSRRFL